VAEKGPRPAKTPAQGVRRGEPLVSIEEDALRFNSDVVFSILHSEVDGVSLAVPEGWNVLGVSGEGDGDHADAGGRFCCSHRPFT